MNQIAFTLLKINTTVARIAFITFILVLSMVSAAHGRERAVSSAVPNQSNAGIGRVYNYDPRSFVLPNQWVQNDARQPAGKLRSRGEVVREVKRQYNAEVLKITLNQLGSAYSVRILMPNGRVRQITVSARR